MDLLFDYRLWKVNLFILLAFIIQTSCEVCLSDIKEICCIDSGTYAITSLPNNTNCTALAFYSDSQASNIDTINSLRINQKRVYILNDYGYSDYKDKLNPDNLDSFLTDLGGIINGDNLDILIFEGLVMPDDPGYDNLIQMDIRRMFQRLNQTYPNLLCGMFLRWSPDIGVNLQYLEKVVPFFVLRSFDNHKCYHKESQAEMDPIDPVEEIEDKVKGIITIMNGDKLCIGIRILVKSTKKSYAEHYDDESYTDFCVKGADEDRRFCMETLSNFYKKGILVSKYNLAGAIIQSLDRDDYECKCGCGCYPVMTAIDAGIQCLPEPDVTKCSTWTLLQKDRD